MMCENVTQTEKKTQLQFPPPSSGRGMGKNTFVVGYFNKYQTLCTTVFRARTAIFNYYLKSQKYNVNI